MTRSILNIAAAVLAISALASAQDPTKVEPKHYRLDFENDHVQVVSVHYGPHEKSVLHDHPGGVVVCITGGHLLFTDENGKSREVFSKPGEARWFPPFKHKVENLGDTTYSAVYVGIKGMTNASATQLTPAEQQQQIAQALAYLASEPGALH
jgi:quercetin dioxygenase-like cupin family protein